MDDPRSGRWLPRFALLLLLVPGTGQGRRDETSTEALDAVNRAGRAAYAAARERMLERAGPVVLWNGEDLVMRYGSVRSVSRPIPVRYHDLKAIGHVVLGLHSLIAPYGGGAPGDRRLFELKRYQEVIAKARKAIRERDLSKVQIERQEKILAGCDEIVGRIIATGKVDSKAFVEALRKLRPMLDENSYEAARGQIEGMDRVMQGWKGKLSEADWKRLTVIVQGSQQPRKDNLAVQYFARLLGETGEGQRILYAEGLFDEQRALALLGTKRVDRQMGIDLWDDPDHMNRDLLAEVARRYLERGAKKE